MNIKFCILFMLIMIKLKNKSSVLSNDKMFVLSDLATLLSIVLGLVRNFIMIRLTPEQRLQTVQINFKNHGSVRKRCHALRPFYGRHNCSSKQLIRLTMDWFPTMRTKKGIAAVGLSIEENPNESISHRAQQFELCAST